MMKLRSRNPLKATIETERRLQLTRLEVFEMHLFDEDAPEERTLCGRDTTGAERRGVRGYLEDRLHDNEVGTVCQHCKDRVAPFMRKIVVELEADERVEEADEYRMLAGTLTRETGQYNN